MFCLGVSIALDVLAAIFIPLFAFVLNWRLRASKGYALSAAADFVLALMVFDLGALIAHDVFEAAIPSQFFRTFFFAHFVVLFCVSGILWSTVLLHLEHRLVRDYDPEGRQYLGEFPDAHFYLCMGDRRDAAVAPYIPVSL